MNNLLESWSHQYYLEPFLCMLLIITSMVAYKYKTAHKIMKHIPVYIISLLIVYISGSFSSYLSDSNSFKIILAVIASYCDYFFIPLELIIFSRIYYQLIVNSKFKTAIVLTNVIFIFYFLYKLIEDKQFPLGTTDRTQAEVYVMEGAILLPSCLFYFIELFLKQSNLSLKNEPAFWLSTGLLFFLGCTLPYSILENYLRTNNFTLLPTSYTIYYVFYILLFIMIIKAYLCKPMFK